MKTMKKSIVLLLTVFLSLVSLAIAQTNEAQQRQRDIKIAEGIIAEIFEDQSSNPPFTFFRDRNVRGEYISGFGVHFTVSSGFSNYVHISDLRSMEDEISIEINNDGTSTSVSQDEDKIKEKFFEYMLKYASLIGGVPDDETIRITYAPNQGGSATWIFLENGDQKKMSQNGLSVWAKVSDLKQFRNGDISEEQVIGRINTHTLGSEETYSDFNIFASVLETALNSAEIEHLRVSRKPQMEYLPGLGVRYRVQVSTRPSVILNEINIFDGNFEFKMDSLRLNLDESLKLMEKSLNPLILKLDSVVDLDMSEEEREQMREEIREQQREVRNHHNSMRDELRRSPEAPSLPDSLDLSEEADAIMDQLLDVIENYGSTLTSLADDEMLMISVNWSGRSDDLPERTEVRIKKSDLLRGEEPDIEEIERR